MTNHQAQGRDSARRTLALPASVFLLLTIDTCLAMGRGWNPGRSRIEMLAVATVVALAIIGASLTLLPAGRRWLAARSTALLAIQISTLVALSAGEGALKLLGDRGLRAPFHAHPRGLKEVFTPQLPGASRVARFSVNSLGLRGPEAPADPKVFRILAVGGSTTEDVYLDDHATWTHLLMNRLNADGGRRYWVASAGRSGFASVEHLAFAESSDLVEKADALIVLVGINDLARMVWGESADRVSRPAAPLWARSCWVELIKRAASAWLSSGNLVMDRNALFVHDAQAARHQARIVDGEIPIGPYLSAYRRRLEALVDACHKRDVALVLLDQPTVFRASMSAEEERRLWLLRRSNGTYLPPRRMRELMDRFNVVTLEVARRHGVPMVRLSSLDGQAALFYDDCHFSELGAREVARRIADDVPWNALPYRPR